MTDPVERTLRARRREGAEVVLRVVDEPNPAFAESARGHRIDVRRRPLLGPESRVFAMGSCFATNLRMALLDRGVPALPHYETIERDRAREVIGYRDHLFHYDTFAIRQELERALLGRAAPFVPEPIADGFRPHVEDGVTPRFHDPERQYVMADDAAGLVSVVERLDRCVAQAVASADVYILTLGLIEAWRDRRSGRHVWGAQVRRMSEDPDRYELHLSTFEENLENVRWVVASLAERYPARPVVLTVSPVPLGRTFTDWDVVTANTYSKSMLRAVAGAVELEFDHVSYWPSYEIATRTDLYLADGRHVAPYAVDFIIDGFLLAYGQPGWPASPAAGDRAAVDDRLLVDPVPGP